MVKRQPQRQSSRRNTTQSSELTIWKALDKVKYVALVVAAVVGAIAGYDKLDWWKPASTAYVDSKAAGLSHKIEMVDTSTLQNRLETLTAAKNQAISEQTDLQLKEKVAEKSNADADYVRMIQTRAAFVADRVTQLTNQILGVTEAINKKNAADATAR